MSETSGNSSLPAVLRPHRSSVHGYFDQVELKHPSTKQIVSGSLCKFCKASFLHRISSNLKSHLRNKHPETFAEVARK